MLEEGILRFPLFGISNVIMQGILLGKPGAQTAWAGAYEILDRAQKLNHL